MTSKFERSRRKYKPKKTDAFTHALSNVSASEAEDGTVRFKSGFDFSFAGKRIGNVAIVLSDRLRPGVCNCIAGVHEAIVRHSPTSVLYGAVSGFSGFLEDGLKEITRNDVSRRMNRGGYDFLGASDFKPEKDEQFETIARICRQRDVNLIILIGGDELNSVLLNLSGYFESNDIQIRIISIPNCVNGGKTPGFSDYVFGADTVSRMYCEAIGNIQLESASSAKRYHFASVSGPNASRTLLECALACQSTLTLIGEEIRGKKLTFDNVSDAVADCVKTRKIAGKNHGVIIFPDNLFEYASDTRLLLRELSSIRRERKAATPEDEMEYLSSASLNALNSLPKPFRSGLRKCFSKNGQIEYSMIETGYILAQKVAEKLSDYYFNYEIHDLDFEANCAFPTNFDCTYSYNLGICAVLLGMMGKTGYVAAIDGLEKKPKHWLGLGIPLQLLMSEETRGDRKTKVIRKYSVDLNSKLFDRFRSVRTAFMLNDEFSFPGPIDYSSKEIEKPYFIQFSNEIHLSEHGNYGY